MGPSNLSQKLSVGSYVHLLLAPDEGLQPPNLSPGGPMTGIIVDQKDYYKRFLAFSHLKGPVQN